MKYTQTVVLLAFILSSIGCNKKAVQIYDYDLGSDEWKAQMHSNYFMHGLASGDPMANQVIIWTRISNSPGDIEVDWIVSPDENFKNITAKGTSTTSGSKDYTVKIDVKGLKPGTHYYYRFIHNERYSPVGRTKTLANSSVDKIKLGIVSCSNYEFGYFNAYNGLVQEDLDAIVHLGDYIYEYAPDKYGDKNFERKHLPANELLSLEDYRTRYAQYRTDIALQSAHAIHPFIMIWDDHEIANNAYEDGAQNHQDNEGDFMARKRIAKQAYYEWQPIRESKDSVLYRSFQFGDLLDLIMLDERYIGRNEPPDSPEAAKLERSMLGLTQLNWFKDKLNKSKAQWKVIGNQVIFAPCDLSLVRPDSPVNLDAWDGYDYERNDIVDFLSKTPIDNTIFVTGDTHSSWAFEIPSNKSTYRADGNSCAIEIGTPSITSANWDEGGTTEEAKLGEQALRMSNPHLKYVNGRDHGYTILYLTKSGATAKWYYTQDIKQVSAEIKLAKEISIGVDSKFIEE